MKEGSASVEKAIIPYRDDMRPPIGSTAMSADGFPGSLRALCSNLVFRSALYRRLVLDGPVPNQLLRGFPCHAPGDRTQADAIVGKEFLFYGRRVPFGVMPFSVLPPGRTLAAALHGFAWLGDLAAIGTGEARVRARALVTNWISANRRWTELAWSPAVLGRRLAAWLAAAEFVLDGADGDERVRFLESAGRQARHLARIANSIAKEPGVFDAAEGEIAAALCLDAVPLAPALGRLESAIAHHILADGGHVGRNPAVQLSIFRSLVEIRSALDEAHQQPLDVVNSAIQIMAPALRTLRHGDGRLALFHGAKESDRTLIDSLLAASRVSTSAVASLPQTGFERVSAGRMLLLVDAGSPPANGHASPLAFELSIGRERLVVNCGAFAGDDPRWHAALRSTAAHSTVGIGNASVRAGGWITTRPIHTRCERQSADGAVWLDMSHDGYHRHFGIVHRRRLYVTDAGSEIRGEDSLDGRRGRRFEARFHLHPDVRASLSADGVSVELKLPSSAVWRFLAVGGLLSLEESAYLGVADQPRRTQQIVVSGETGRDGARLKWAFRQDGDG
ncbi:MAG: heparinase II/III family protein [Rhodospirillales bacterium]|nr:heparinase II/III family protein [Rhodospirillales bacterium]